MCSTWRLPSGEEEHQDDEDMPTELPSMGGKESTHAALLMEHSPPTLTDPRAMKPTVEGGSDDQGTGRGLGDGSTGASFGTNMRVGPGCPNIMSSPQPQIEPIRPRGRGAGGHADGRGM